MFAGLAMLTSTRISLVIVVLSGGTIMFAGITMCDVD